jgi:hypothetical protein
MIRKSSSRKCACNYLLDYIQKDIAVKMGSNRFMICLRAADAHAHQNTTSNKKNYYYMNILTMV